jgi:tetratricopeptide (TPR) repeat protein
MSPARAKQLWKRVLFSALIYAAFFLLLEIALAVVGVESVVEREDPFRGFSGLVSVFERQGDSYRTRSVTAPYRIFNQQSFRARKPPKGLRIFCLGGSSAYGYPWDAGAAFTAILGDLLAEAHPDREIEAINAAGISYAMHRLRFVAREIVDYEPDVLIIYSGHNEFLEPSFFNELKRRSAEWNRVRHALSYSRTYSALRSLLIRPDEAGRSRAEQFEMLVRRNETLAYNEEEKREIVEGYREGLREIVRLARGHGAKVVVATVPCNLRDWHPKRSSAPAQLGGPEGAQWLAAFRSGKRAQGEGQFERAASELRRALRLAPSHAMTHHLLGRAYEGLEEWGRAREAYQLACDYDASLVRRLSAINDAVRQIASEEGALLVDVERIFEERSEHGLVGFNLIEDYVHPTGEGHQIIAWHIWEAMAREGWLGRGSEARRAIFERVVAGRRPVVSSRNVTWLFNQAAVLRHEGHMEQAIEKYRRALEISPDYAAAHDGLGLVLKAQGRTREALGHFRRALELDPSSAETHNSLGLALASLGKLDEAIGHFRRSLELDADHAYAQMSLGTALRARGDLEPAVSHLRRALEINPGLVAAANNLAWILATADDPGLRDGAEAVELASDAARLTDYESAEILDTLAVAYASEGRFAEATRTASQALELVGPEATPLAKEIRDRLQGFRAGRPYRPHPIDR